MKLTAYDFVDKTTDKKKAGISIDQEGKKAVDFYNVKNNEKWECLHGFPPSTDINFKDKDELTIYF